MIEIRNIDGKPLQLPLNEKLTVEIVSTILNTDDVMQGSYSYPFRFPVNEYNTSWLGGGTTAEQLSRREYAVTLAVDGLPIERGRLTFRVNGKYADAYLKLDLGELAGSLRALRLRDLMNERLPLGSSLADVWNKLHEYTLAAPGSVPIRFPPFRNDLMVEPEFEGGEGYSRPFLFNRYVPWTLAAFTPGIIGHLVNAERNAHKHQLVPMVSLVYVIRKLAARLGFTAMGEWLSDPAVEKMVLFNTQAMPQIPVAAWNAPDSPLPNGPLYVELGRHVPDISVGDFLKAIRGWMCVGVFFKSRTRTLRLKTYRTIKNERDYQDFTGGYIPETDQYEWPDKAGYTLESYVEDGDELLKETPYYLRAQTVGDGSQEIPLGVGTCLMHRGVNPDTWPVMNQAWTIPQVKQAGNLADAFYAESQHYSPYRHAESSEPVPAPKNKFGLRLLMYHGMQPDAVGKYYPLASSLSYNYDYQTVSALSLLPGEPDDVFAQHQRYYYEMRATSQHVQVELLADLAQVEGFLPERAVGLRLRNRVFSKWLPERLTYQLPAGNGLVRARFEGVQLIPVSLKPTIPDGLLYGAVWVKLSLENGSTDANFSARVELADITLFFYEKGNQTGPVDVPSLLVNYRRVTTLYDENAQVTATTTDDLTDTASGLSYILKAAAVLREEETYADPENPQLEAWRVWKVVFYSLLPGAGYRIIQ